MFTGVFFCLGFVAAKTLPRRFDRLAYEPPESLRSSCVPRRVHVEVTLHCHVDCRVPQALAHDFDRYTRRRKQRRNRLSRRALYILQALQDAADVEFVICDLPGATPLTIGIYALIAQEEAEKISARTKAALAARKARGLPLGVNVTGKSYLTIEGAAKGRAKAAATHRSKANQAYEHLLPLIRDLRAQRLGFHTIAKRLDEQGYTSRAIASLLQCKSRAYLRLTMQSSALSIAP